MGTKNMLLSDTLWGKSPHGVGN